MIYLYNFPQKRLRKNFDIFVQVAFSCLYDNCEKQINEKCKIGEIFEDFVKKTEFLISFKNFQDIYIFGLSALTNWYFDNDKYKYLFVFLCIYIHHT